MKLIHDKHGKLRVDVETKLLVLYSIALDSWAGELAETRAAYKLKQARLKLPRSNIKQEVININHPPDEWEDRQKRIDRLTERIEAVQAEKVSIDEILAKLDITAPDAV